MHSPVSRQKACCVAILDGLVGRDVRERLIRERWMKDEANAKEYDDIFEDCRDHDNFEAGGRSYWKPSPDRRGLRRCPVPDGLSCSLPSPAARVRWGRRPVSLPDRPPAARSGQLAAQQSGPRGGAVRGARAVCKTCYYCDIAHQGGWHRCHRRLTENPSLAATSRDCSRTRRF